MMNNFTSSNQYNPIIDNMNCISPLPANTPIGMAYVPFQQWETPYSLDVAFPIGTLFSQLDLPFTAYKEERL